jgi:hypothetical protein
MNVSSLHVNVKPKTPDAHKQQVPPGWLGLGLMKDRVDVCSEEPTEAETKNEAPRMRNID